MTVVTPHIARGRRLLFGLFVTASLITLVLAVALALYTVPRLG
ncbi:hypothetical protein [Streptomyces cinnamoneus]|uniref:Uncharacterized protein n=1 Tax=Streptomyces cinnamoneus TaxID=53446 RepID=A0A918TR59_STRCJ|nr:hypothetical protein [Streptomyces cinnamoneus]GHC58253.1 hypothetical protein GCM10010507_38840 [Streptomyces cinnamoneus]